HRGFPVVDRRDDPGYSQTVPAEFPRDPSEVTPAWLGKALGRSSAADGARIVAVRSEVVGPGQMGVSVRYALEWNKHHPRPPASVVCKFASPDPTSRATGLALRTYEVEVNFYRALASTVHIRTPRCHFADIDLSSGEFVLVLEDLAPAAQGDQMA